MDQEYPRRRLAEWTPDLGDVDDWLAAQAAEGWRHEYEGPGTEVVMDGKVVQRFAMPAHPTDVASTFVPARDVPTVGGISDPAPEVPTVRAISGPTRGPYRRPNSD